VAIASHIALEEVDADYSLAWVDFQTGAQQSADYLKINPKARVPTLVTSQGILTETSAILNYIAATHPKAGLTPSDPFERAKMEELCQYLASTVHVAHAHKMRGHRWSDDPAAQSSMTAKVASNMADCYQLIEADYLQGPWVLGDSFSLADIYLYAVTRWLEGDGVPMAQFPKVAAHFALMIDRPAVQRVTALHD
jgi:glutathione S-transferase